MDYLWNKRDCKWLPSVFMLASLGCVCLLSLQDDLCYVTQGSWLLKGPTQSFQCCQLAGSQCPWGTKVKRDEIHQESETCSITKGFRPGFLCGQTSHLALMPNFA